MLQCNNLKKFDMETMSSEAMSVDRSLPDADLLIFQ